MFPLGQVKLGWDLKQQQLKELKDILTHENYTDTGLANGENDSIMESCKGLDEYIDKANKTAWDEEKEEMDLEFEELEIAKEIFETQPCPCIWAQWEEWSQCSTSCGEDGVKKRTRVVEKNATNNGPACDGPSEDSEYCDGDPCRKFEICYKYSF